MTESIARAERFDAPPSASLVYLWDVPNKPVSVRVGMDVIARLEREVVESFRSVNSRGSEIGGILLGRVLPGARPLVAVEDYELVPCEYSRGPLYRLAETDRERLDRALAQRAAAGDRGRAVVGLFRSNTRKGLSLDPEDVTLFTERMNDPQKVFLLVRPFATKASMAGFFICEEGRIHSEATALEFPFSPSELEKQKLISTAAPAEDRQAAAEEEPAPPASAAAAPAPAPKPSPRAQVVPIASRRDAPAAPPAPPAPPAAQAPAQEALPAPLFGISREIPAPKAASSSNKVLWICGAAGAVLVLVMLLLVYPGLLNRRSFKPAAPAGDSSTLALRVERSSGQLLLTWNRESEAVKTATKAMLTISDGEQHENIDIDLAQLRNGSVVYSPLTGDVSFRLEVTSATAGKSQNEYVRVLGTRPSAMPQTAQSGGQNPAAAARTPAELEANQAESAGNTTPSAAPVRAMTWRPGQATGDSLADRLRPARSADLPEPPSLADSGGSASGLPANLSSPASGIPLPPPVPAAPQNASARPAPPASTATRETARLGGQVRPAKLVYRKDPVYPIMAKQARIRGLVRLDATVGRDGKVVGVTPVSGPPLLQQAAIDAVKQWIYSPTLLNGQPVEIVTRVEIGFNLSGN